MNVTVGHHFHNVFTIMKTLSEVSWLENNLELKWTVKWFIIGDSMIVVLAMIAISIHEIWLGLDGSLNGSVYHALSSNLWICWIQLVDLKVNWKNDTYRDISLEYQKNQPTIEFLLKMACKERKGEREVKKIVNLISLTGILL